MGATRAARGPERAARVRRDRGDQRAVAIQSGHAFLAWVSAHTTTPPEAYRTIKLANLGLVDVADADAGDLEFGDLCAVG